MNKSLLALPVVLLTACSGPRRDTAPVPVAVQAAPDLESVIGGEGRPEQSFTLFGSALMGSGVARRLDPTREYTLIAVRDRELTSAIAELREYDVRPEDFETVLEFHVLPGRIGSQLLRADTSFETLSGQRLFVSNWGGEVEMYARGADGSRNSSARVVATDVPFEQGLVHFVDRPLVPATDDLRATLERLGDFEVFLAAVEIAGERRLLKADGPFTLFAPTDRVLERLLGGPIDLSTVADDPSFQRLADDVVRRHLVPGRLYSSDFATGTLAPVGGDSFRVDFVRGRFVFGGARVERADLDASNGVVHVVDSVLLD